MKFLSKIIAFAVIVSAAVACGRDARNGVDSQSPNGEQTGFGAAQESQGDSTNNNNNNENDSNIDGGSTSDSSNMAPAQGSADDRFVLAAADGGLLEVRLGELAAKNATSSQVKELGRTMVTEHQKTNNELKNLATQMNISIPTSLSENSQAKFDELSKMKGGNFDNAYEKMMVTTHEESITLFRTQSNVGTNQKLREWAGVKLPILEHHLQMAQKISEGASTVKGQ